MGFDDLANTAGSLVLGLSLISSPLSTDIQDKPKRPASPAQNLDDDQFYGPSLNLSLSEETYQIHDHSFKKVDSDNKIKVAVFSTDHRQLSFGRLYRQDSAASSLISNVSVKRERESTEDGEIERVHSSRISDELYDDDDDIDGSNGRKKLRLTKLQSALLEESFKIHTTLNPKQKQDLARELKLRPRQVEVWFQNRRARTKLKQTEVNCQFLKKCCETLTDENRRLHRELQELKALKLAAAQPLCMQLSAATLTMCPSCERAGAASSPAADATAKSPLTVAMKPHGFYNHFNSPAAC